MADVWIEGERRVVEEERVEEGTETRGKIALQIMFPRAL